MELVLLLIILLHNLLLLEEIITAGVLGCPLFLTLALGFLGRLKEAEPELKWFYLSALAWGNVPLACVALLVLIVAGV